MVLVIHNLLTAFPKLEELVIDAHCASEPAASNSVDEAEPPQYPAFMAHGRRSTRIPFFLYIYMLIRAFD